MNLLKRIARWNWWKIGFFIALFLFECAREWAVIEAFEPPKIASIARVDRYDTFVTASGQWQRLDGGSDMLPGSTKIECWQDQGKCYEISYMFMNGYVGEPNLDVFDAKFSDDAVTYENDAPQCAHYSVRIDLNLKKVIATRDRKAKPSNEMCAKLEPRIEMTLGEGRHDYRPDQEHFVPVVWLLVRLMDAR
ncbi:hypothetical protein [Sphingomonas sp. G-3-2-10]|uniref:hypothetical protein n=1 Tax=Sphingomonas sp. G-3-2-10 TaxID=2728838 RepID=UPI00146C888F|nr:hypothetical protein [Sphingomonas sp. G-3-2-10]NML04248.1 hypothetical protein [Sphingomonas sp. G-3-2-10]